MKLVFMGTSEFAVPALQEILKSGHTVISTVTKPDRPKGRGGRTFPTPVKQFALANHITVMESNRIKDEKAIRTIQDFDPDLIVVVSFGQIVPSELLSYPKYGCINLHPSLLPKYRGPAPIQRALMAGETTTGVTTMFLDEGLDTGDIILQKEIAIPENYDYGDLEQTLARYGASLLVDTINAIAQNQISRKRQNNEEATYAPLITKEDEKIVWSRSALDINHQIRALSPYPGAYASMANKRFKIFRARVMAELQSGVPGEIIGLTGQGIQVATGQGALEILEVQREGKKRMICSNFLQGFRIEPGDRLDVD